MSPIWQRALGIALLILPVIPPAVIVLISIRILLRYAAKKPNLFRLLALGIVNLLLVQFGIEIISFIYGLSTQAWIDAAYAHRIPIEGTEAVLAGGFAYFFAFSRIYGYLALLPAIVFAALFVCWILIIAAAAICRLIEEFLRLQVEEADSRPFTAFATALCMLIALYSGARLLPYGVIGHYLQFMEHRINRWGFDLGERSISRRPEAPDKEYILYNVQCQAFLIATEFIGPSAQAAQNIQSRVSKVLKEWGESNEPAAVTPAPKIPKK